jgi:hypothetical protein
MACNVTHCLLILLLATRLFPWNFGIQAKSIPIPVFSSIPLARTTHRKHNLIYCCVLDRIYTAVAWQRVDQIRYIIHLSMALQPFVGPYPIFSFLILYTVGRTPCTGGSVRRKASTYTQNKTNTEQMHTDIHASSGIRTQYPSVPWNKDC